MSALLAGGQRKRFEGACHVEQDVVVDGDGPFGRDTDEASDNEGGAEGGDIARDAEPQQGFRFGEGFLFPGAKDQALLSIACRICAAFTKQPSPSQRRPRGQP